MMNLLELGIVFNVLAGVVNLILAALSYLTFQDTDKGVMHLLLTIGAFVLATALSSIRNGYYLKDILNMKEVECKKKKSFFD